MVQTSLEWSSVSSQCYLHIVQISIRLFTCVAQVLIESKYHAYTLTFNNTQNIYEARDQK